MNLINGGKHAAGKLAFQEYKVVPQTDSIEESLHIGTTMMYALKEEIIAHHGAVSANIGDEGGFAPDLDSVRKPLELFMRVAEKTGFTNKIKFALDIAASSFQTDNTYEVDGNRISVAEMETLIRTIIRDFPMLYIEDPFPEEAFDDFARLNANSGVVIVGDDLTVTNTERLKMAIEKKSISGIIIKPNQIGTLTETLDTMALARANTIECVVSHRSGETSDDFIADLAYAFGTFAIKTGAPQRGERVAKYNRLWSISSHS
jgi:enolase